MNIFRALCVSARSSRRRSGGSLDPRLPMLTTAALSQLCSFAEQIPAKASTPTPAFSIDSKRPSSNPFPLLPLQMPLSIFHYRPCRTCRKRSNSIPFMRLRTLSCTQGMGYLGVRCRICPHTRTPATPFLSCAYFTVLCRPRGGGPSRHSTLTTSSTRNNSYPPSPDLRHNPAAQWHQPQHAPCAGRIQ
jgi:hypothetical protein